MTETSNPTKSMIKLAFPSFCWGFHCSNQRSKHHGLSWHPTTGSTVLLCIIHPSSVDITPREPESHPPRQRLFLEPPQLRCTALQKGFGGLHGSPASWDYRKMDSLFRGQSHVEMDDWGYPHDESETLMVEIDVIVWKKSRCELGRITHGTKFLFFAPIICQQMF